MDIPKQKHIVVPIKGPPSTGPVQSAFSRSAQRLSGKILVEFCGFLFGWLDRRAAWRNEKRFRDEIESQLKFLFDDYSAQVIPNDGSPSPPSFGGAYVTVAVEPLLLRFVRGRGDFSVTVASSFAPQLWLDFQLVANGIAEWSLTEPRPYAYSLEDFASMLRPRLDQLLEELSNHRFEATLHSAIQRHNDAIDQYAAEARKAGFKPIVW